MKAKLKYFLAGIAVLTTVQLLVAWKPAAFIGTRAISVGSIVCSADGNIVYAVDLENIWKSTNAGATWESVKAGKRPGGL